MRVIKGFRREQADYDQLALANAAYRDVNYRTVVQSGLLLPVRRVHVGGRRGDRALVRRLTS